MTDGFRWHPEARLYNSTGAEVPQSDEASATVAPSAALASHLPPASGGQVAGTVLADSPGGLTAAIGHPAFRIGAADQPPPVPHEQPVFETLTSGSTGQPRRIRRTQASWTASFAINATLGIGPGARIAVLGRLIHSLSLYGAVEGLHLGAEVHLLFDLRPDRQRAALGNHRITHLYATPAQLRLLTEGQGICHDLRVILVGGSKLDPALRVALAALAPNAQVREFYGAAETSFITLADEATPEPSVGRPYPGVDLQLDKTGEVWVKSPYLFLGYATGQGEAATATRWRDGWLSVGEIGHLKNGFLYLKGRAGRMVTVADQNVFPEEIETLLHTLPGVTRAAILPVPDARRGHALIAVLQGDPAREAALLAALRRVLGPLKSPRVLIWRTDWPTLASGKTDLKALEASLWPT
jgi:long-chain acyl-CoA synthetase